MADVSEGKSEEEHSSFQLEENFSPLEINAQATKPAQIVENPALATNQPESLLFDEGVAQSHLEDVQRVIEEGKSALRATMKLEDEKMSKLSEHQTEMNKVTAEHMKILKNQGDVMKEIVRKNMAQIGRQKHFNKTVISEIQLQLLSVQTTSNTMRDAFEKEMTFLKECQKRQVGDLEKKLAKSQSSLKIMIEEHTKEIETLLKLQEKDQSMLQFQLDAKLEKENLEKTARQNTEKQVTMISIELKDAHKEELEQKKKDSEQMSKAFQSALDKKDEMMQKSITDFQKKLARSSNDLQLSKDEYELRLMEKNLEIQMIQESFENEKSFAVQKTQALENKLQTHSHGYQQDVEKLHEQHSLQLAAKENHFKLQISLHKEMLRTQEDDFKEKFSNIQAQLARQEQLKTFVKSEGARVLEDVLFSQSKQKEKFENDLKQQESFQNRLEFAMKAETTKVRDRLKLEKVLREKDLEEKGFQIMTLKKNFEEELQQKDECYNHMKADFERQLQMKDEIRKILESQRESASQEQIVATQSNESSFKEEVSKLEQNQSILENRRKAQVLKFQNSMDILRADHEILMQAKQSIIDNFQQNQVQLDEEHNRKILLLENKHNYLMEKAERESGIALHMQKAEMNAKNLKIERIILEHSKAIESQSQNQESEREQFLREIERIQSEMEVIKNAAMMKGEKSLQKLEETRAWFEEKLQEKQDEMGQMELDFQTKLRKSEAVAEEAKADLRQFFENRKKRSGKGDTLEN